MGTDGEGKNRIFLPRGAGVESHCSYIPRGYRLGVLRSSFTQIVMELLSFRKGYRELQRRQTY